MVDGSTSITIQQSARSFPFGLLYSLDICYSQIGSLLLLLIQLVTWEKYTPKVKIHFDEGFDHSCVVVVQSHQTKISQPTSYIKYASLMEIEGAKEKETPLTLPWIRAKVKRAVNFLSYRWISCVMSPMFFGAR
jgi:hypothetical protein